MNTSMATCFFLFPLVLLFASCVIPESNHVEPTYHLLTELQSDRNDTSEIGRVSFYVRQVELLLLEARVLGVDRELRLGEVGGLARLERACAADPQVLFERVGREEEQGARLQRDREEEHLLRQVLFNEIAPRPHNSGHYTLDACFTEQHEAHLRAVRGLRSNAIQICQNL